MLGRVLARGSSADRLFGRVSSNAGVNGLGVSDWLPNNCSGIQVIDSELHAALARDVPPVIAGACEMRPADDPRVLVSSPGAKGRGLVSGTNLCAQSVRISKQEGPAQPRSISDVD